MKKLLILFFLFLSVPTFGAIIPPGRVVPWQGVVGVDGGIPARETICYTIDAGTYGNDSTDATSEINTRIANCPVGQTVYLPAGTYRTSGIINLKTGVTLRGEGPLVTKIHFRGTFANKNYSMIEARGTASSSGSGISITSGLTKGSTDITLSNASTISVGDYVTLDQLNNGTTIDDDTSTGGTCTWCGRASGTRSLGQISKVTAKNGNVVTVDPGLHITLESGQSPQMLRLGSSSSFITNAGLEDLQAEIISATTMPYASLRFQYASNSWIKNVYSPLQAEQAHLHLIWSYRPEVRDSHFKGVRGTPATTGYGMVIGTYTTAGLVENNIFEESYSGIIPAWGASGNVMGYNYFANMWYKSNPLLCSPSIFFHGMHTKMNLAEGNDGSKFWGDWYWGNHSYNTAYRNYFKAQQESPWQTYSYTRWPVKIDWKNQNYNVVGNVLGLSSDTYTYETPPVYWSSPTIYMLGYKHNNDSPPYEGTARSTLLRHGNWDESTDSVKWCDDSGEPGCQGGDASQTIPNSLYLAVKPSWWCNETPWPPIGSDLSPMVSDIPAKIRYEGGDCTTGETDELPPVRYNSTPGSLPSGTTQYNITLTTTDDSGGANCRWDADPLTAYADMSDTFDTTGGSSHSELVTGLSDGNTYSYYVRCEDLATPPNANQDDYLISFSVQEVGVAGGSFSGQGTFQ
jgi:hypothetical protein